MKYVLRDTDHNIIMEGVSKEEIMAFLGIKLSYFYESLVKGTRIQNKYKIERYGA